MSLIKHLRGLSDGSFNTLKTMEISEFRVLAKHCFLTGKNAVQAKDWLDKCYGDSAPEKSTVIDWYAEFKRDHRDTSDNVDQSGHPIKGDDETFSLTETNKKDRTRTAESGEEHEPPPAKTIKIKKERRPRGGRSSGKGKLKTTL